MFPPSGFPFLLLQPRSRPMSLFCLLGFLRPVDRKSKGSQRDRRRRDRFPGPRFLPQLEALECRTLPSTLTVLNNADSGDGSLRAMLALASSGDTINFDPGLTGQTITLTGGELVINQSLDIEGLGASHLTISGNDASRVFDITGGGLTVAIDDLAIVHGQATQGARIDHAGSTLTVFRCTLSNNPAVGVPGGDA